MDGSWCGLFETVRGGRGDCVVAVTTMAMRGMSEEQRLVDR